ncbi:MAG: family 16 glycosylhydrolase [Clostridia bacterium]|nr:family 16 glycosylhydrolase [Clostridia bacterium]
MKNRLFSILLAICMSLTFFAGCVNSGGNSSSVGENTDNLQIIIANESTINCNSENGVTFGLDIVVTGVTDRSVGFIIDETNSFVSVNEENYTLVIKPGVPDKYVFRVTVYSLVDRSKNAYKDFIVRTESDTPTDDPSNTDKPLGPQVPVVPNLGDGKPEYLADGRIKEPSSNVVDSFNAGVNPSKWYISTQTWGGLPNYNGCRSENVSYTSDGILLLKTQGLYSTDIPLSGAAIITKETYGAGSYQVAMKVVPRLGVCNAIWTYYYGRGGEDNHEIDIELPGHKTPGGGEIGYDRVLNTNWLSERNSTSKGIITETPANDGDWHLYRFDWHTSPTPRIDYYVDGVLTHSESNLVPTYKGLFWIGAWLPRNWCGQPDFEVDYMMVDWFSYTPFNQPTLDSTPVPAAYETNLNKYPWSPVSMPQTSYISNGTFEGNASAWKITGNASISAGAYEGSKCLTLNASSSASQTITAVYGGFEYDLSAFAKSAGNGNVTVTFYNRNNELLASGTKTFTLNSSMYSNTTGRVTAPAGSDYMVVTVNGVSGVTQVDNLVLRLV